MPFIDSLNFASRSKLKSSRFVRRGKIWNANCVAIRLFFCSAMLLVPITVCARDNVSGENSACRASQLAAAWDRKESDQIEGGLGHHALTIALQNISKSPCTLEGITEVALLGLNGRSLSVRVCPNCPDYLFPTQRVNKIHLAPNTSAYLLVGYNINDNNGKWSCRQSVGFRIILRGQCGEIDGTPLLDKLQASKPQ